MLSQRTQDLITNAIADEAGAAELIAAINASEGFTEAADVAAVSTANATDLASAEALANANKTAINAILSSLKAAGIMA